MIRVNLSDTHVTDNISAIATLKKSGLFSEAEIQKLYDEQVEQDTKMDGHKKEVM